LAGELTLVRARQLVADALADWVWQSLERSAHRHPQEDPLLLGQLPVAVSLGHTPLEPSFAYPWLTNASSFRRLELTSSSNSFSPGAKPSYVSGSSTGCSLSGSDVAAGANGSNSTPLPLLTVPHHSHRPRQRVRH
jgi:hypothetical protein